MEITGRTRLIGLLADPIAQVRTPSVLNPLLAARGADLIVVPLHVPGLDLSAAMAGLRRAKSFAGFLATVPHKPALPALCDVVLPSARQVGAANCARLLADGRLVCATFDGTGFVAGLRQQGLDPQGHKVFLAGAGGAAAGVAFALAEAGIAEIAILNRTRDKAESLAARLAAEFPALKTYAADSASPAGFSLVVNGSSLGMQETDAPPVDYAGLEPRQIVAEVVMAPEMTPLLRAAAGLGARIHLGKHMLAGQLTAIADFFTRPEAETLAR